MSQTVKLHWNNFQDHTREMLQELCITENYSDVTLVSDDQTLFPAHKFLLSSCSSTFRNIFESKMNQTCVYLRGIPKESLEAILQFMYLGETSFSSDHLNKFMEVAKDLDVKEFGANIDFGEISI